MKKILKKYESLSAPVKASLWYTVCSIVNKGMALLSTPIFTRVMSEEQYGQFSIFQSWVSILIIFTSLNIFLSGYQRGLILFEDDVDSFTSSQLGLIITITIGFCVVYLIAPSFWSNFFELSPVLMLAMFAELFFMPATELWSEKQRFDYKYKKYVALTIVMTAFSLGGGVIAVNSTSYKTEARIYTDMMAKSLAGLSLLVLLFCRGKKFYNKKYWNYALGFNIPLIPHYLSNYVLNQSDRLMIGRMIGKAQTAYYSVAYTISSVMMLVMTAINNSLTPYIYKSIATKKTSNIKKVANGLVVLIACLCICVMAFAPEVIYIFAGEKYTDAIYVIPPVALSVLFIFEYSLFSTIEYYYEKTKWISTATCICAVLNLVLNFVFIRMYGYYAAGYTTLVCYVFLAYIHYLFYKKVLKEQSEDAIYDIKLIFVVSIVALILMLILVLLYGNIYIRYSIILVILAVVVKYKNMIMNLLFVFKNKG